MSKSYYQVGVAVVIFLRLPCRVRNKVWKNTCPSGKCGSKFTCPPENLLAHTFGYFCKKIFSDITLHMWSSDITLQSRSSDITLAEFRYNAVLAELIFLLARLQKVIYDAITANAVENYVVSAANFHLPDRASVVQLLLARVVFYLPRQVKRP